MKFFTASLCLLALAACSSPPPPGAPAATAGSGIDPATAATVTGRIVVEGAIAPAAMIRLEADPKCVELAGAPQRADESLLTGEGQTVENVFVYVKDGLPMRMYPVPAAPVVLDQQQCRYVPRVLGIQVGQQFVIRNSDALLHNVHADSAVNEPFDVGTPVAGVEAKRTFATREVMVPIKCNVHKWMHAHVGVLEHPFYDVSDRAGRFAIEQLPPGTYTIEIWHERLGTQTQQITVGAKETRDVTFTYKVS